MLQMENFAKKSSSSAVGLSVVSEAEDALVNCLLQPTNGPRSRRTIGGEHTSVMFCQSSTVCFSQSHK